MSFRRFRILLLLGLLAAAFGFTWLEQSTVRSWRGPLDVPGVPLQRGGEGCAAPARRGGGPPAGPLPPTTAHGSDAAAAAIRALKADDFADIGSFLEREVARYGVKHAPAMDVTVLPELAQKPPAPPRDGSVLKVMAWSLKLRWWVYRQSDGWLPQPGRIKLFLLYHAPEDGVALEHSLGLQKGLIGVVHVFADPAQAAQNNIVIAHELLHTLGASDKYEAGGMPRYPEGYAEPDLPQSALRREAEIMAGRLVGVRGDPVMPPGLARCVVGPLTAYEIGLDAAFKRRYASAD
jgi:hypothetical protein